VLYFPDRTGIRSRGVCVDDDTTTFVQFSVNWPATVLILVTAVAIALVARMWSGSFGAPWAGHRPVVWFLVVFLLPPVGVVLFIIGAVKQLRAERARARDLAARP
jgi:hypothetical protein